MLKQIIEAHYGYLPKVAQLVLDEPIGAEMLSMGSLSRVMRTQAIHSPVHITTVVIDTFTDPNSLGGTANTFRSIASKTSSLAVD